MKISNIHVIIAVIFLQLLAILGYFPCATNCHFFFPSSCTHFHRWGVSGVVKSYLRVSPRKTGWKTPIYVDMNKRALCIITYH